MLDIEQGPARALYLGLVRGSRRALDGTPALRALDRRATRHPASRIAHLRTLLAVHDAEDLVALDLAWWTYRAMSVVEEFLADRGGQARVFEYGAGASTVWLARRAATVDAVEHVPGWAERVRELLAAAAGVTARVAVHVPPVPESASPEVPSSAPRSEGLDFAPYVAAIDEVPGPPFDLVLVDGRARAASLRRARTRVADDGLLLLDDAQRPRYQPALDEARRAGWEVQVTRGRTPCQPLPRETALLWRQRAGTPLRRRP